MPNDDTIKLLKECNAGVKMAVKSLKDVEERINDNRMKEEITNSIKEHEKIGDKTHELLHQFHDEEKEPNPIAEVMSKLKINFKCAMDSSDREIAKLMIDGCNMGIQSISEYLNQYKGADQNVRNLVQDLVELEQKLMEQLRVYL